MQNNEVKLYCIYCQKEKEESAFLKSNKKRCKDCAKQYNIEYKAKHPEKYRSTTSKVSSHNNQDELTYKTCVGCQQKKIIEAFGRITNGKYIERKNRCLECEKFARQQRAKIRQEQREQQKILDEAYLLSLPYQERVKVIESKKLKKHINRYYGISIERYNAMLQQQNGLCAICRNPPELYQKLVVDHNHTTGHVRGLLCSACNQGLGLFKDNQEYLLNAAKYLKNSTWEE